MAKQILLLVDDDDRRRRVLEVSLRNAGFAVVSVGDGSEALAQTLGAASGQGPALVLSNTRLPGLDGFALCDRIKTDPATTEVGFVFLSDDTRVEARMRGLELGADDYLTRPIYIQELLARIGVVLQRRARERLAHDGTARTFGALEELGPVDLLLTLNRGRKTGVLRVEGRRPLTVWLEAGEVVDAEAGLRLGEEVVYRFLSLAAGRFSVSSEPVARPRRVLTSVEALVNEGMRRLEAWGRTAEQLPGLNTVFAVDHGELAERQAELPPAILELLRLFDGRRTAVEVVDDAALPALDALVAVARLYFEGLLYEERRLATPAPEPGAGGRDLSAWLAQARTGAEGHWPPEPLGMSATGMSALGLLPGTPPPSPGTQLGRPNSSLPPPAPTSALSDLPGPLPPVDPRSPGDFVRALPSVPPPVVAPPSLGPRSAPPAQSTGPLPTLPVSGLRETGARATGALPTVPASTTGHAGHLGAAQPSLVDALLSTATHRPALVLPVAEAPPQAPPQAPSQASAPVQALAQTSPQAAPAPGHVGSTSAPGSSAAGPGIALAPTPPPVSAVGGLPVMGVPATPTPASPASLGSAPNLHDAPLTPQPGLAPVGPAPSAPVGPASSAPVGPAPSAPVGTASSAPVAASASGLPAAGSPAPEARAITDSADELSFFNPRSEEHPEELPEEHHGGALGTPAYIALGLLGAIAVAAALFFGLRDTVTPRVAPKDALRRDWHSTVLAARAPASAPPLVADWRPPANPDAPAQPPQDLPPVDAPPLDAPPVDAPPTDAQPDRPVADRPVADRPPSDRPPSDRPVADRASDEGDAEPVRPAATGDFDALMGEGMGLHDKRQYGKAAARFRKAVATRPGSEPALIALANALIEEGQEKEALKTALAVARINPNNARAHLIIGSVRQNQGQKEAAIEAYERYLSLAPTGELAREVQRVLDGMRPETPR